MLFARLLYYKHFRKMFFRKSIINAAGCLKCYYNAQRISMVTASRVQQSTFTTELTFHNANLQKYLETLRQEFYDLRVNAPGEGGSIRIEAVDRMNRLSDIVRCLEQHRSLLGNMATREDIENEKDEDMRKLIEEETEVYSNLLRKTEQEIMKKMLQLTDEEVYPSLIFEITAGVGGQEAMLFARELFNMYKNFFEHNQWNYETLAEEVTDIGGLRHANVIVHDSAAYNLLCYEGGVHRVQRVPSTEKAGRIHTSTASVAIIPRPANVNISISAKDLKIETKRASGAGGQHVNTTDSAVRVVHLPTGLAVESQTERSQGKNREIAIKRLQAKLLQQQLERDEAKKQATRKSQKGSLNRNEKIRTYNFVQDRITDHRIPNGTLHNLQVFLEGGEYLESFIKRLMEENQKAKLEQLISDWTAREAMEINRKGESGKEQKKHKS